MSTKGKTWTVRRPISNQILQWLRFWAHVEKTASCWLWQGANGAGYGRFKMTGGRKGKLVAAHRFAYEHCVGKIPEGLQLDHLCRTPACVNPQHLEPVTPKENGLRGISPSAINARKTHCKRGHPFSGGNLWIDKNGDRYCKTCWRVRRQAEADYLERPVGEQR